MIIYTLWCRRKGEDTPELLEAWDEYSVDVNPDGWSAACRDAIEAVGSDLEDTRYVNIRVNPVAIDGVFQTSTITGLVEEAS